ncbi:hypothetical protein EYF80_035116 [Liparis tanakae]|uniref:Uncharacterized protein n=1 Tax=Liparis tanakae TaxID=230148 RepID=A0A4Z2GN40_9TELE|nr:hypothetical protein EYF80_035116 [Liparis tanakae]
MSDYEYREENQQAADGKPCKTEFRTSSSALDLRLHLAGAMRNDIAVIPLTPERPSLTSVPL